MATPPNPRQEKSAAYESKMDREVVPTRNIKVALENCLYTSNDQINCGTIISGIYQRYDAMGMCLGNLKLVRFSLDIIRVIDNERWVIIEFNRDTEDGKVTINTHCREIGFFHEHELMKMAEVLFATLTA